MRLFTLLFFLFILLSVAFFCEDYRTLKKTTPVYQTYSQTLTEFSYDRFLNAIATIETGNNPNAIGRAGERSVYQFMESTWYDRTDKAFVLATEDPDLAREVAIKHARWVQDRVKSTHSGLFNDRLMPEETDKIVYYMAIIWNYGYGNFRDYALEGETLPQSVENYAQRVVTLYNESE